MTPAELRAAGEALYGSRWQAPLAREIGVSRSSVLRWAKGSWPMPSDAADRVRRLAEARAQQLRTLAAEAGV